MKKVCYPQCAVSNVENVMSGSAVEAQVEKVYFTANANLYSEENCFNYDHGSRELFELITSEKDMMAPVNFF